MNEKDKKNRDAPDKLPAELIREEAATWFESLNIGGIQTPEEQEAFRGWLQSSPAHAAAFRDLEQAWRDLALLDDIEEWGNEKPSVIEPSTPSWRKAVAQPAMWTALAAGFALVFVYFNIGAVSPKSDSLPLEYATEISQTQLVELADASTVLLSAESAIEVNYTDDSRHVKLKKGAAYFDVTHDASRPFIVFSENTQTRAVGTEFEVWRGQGIVRVSVGEGRVEVVNNADQRFASKAKFLNVGEQVSASSIKGVGDVVPFNLNETLAWRQGRFIYTDTALSTIIADMNRYRQSIIVLSDPALGDLRVTAAFGQDNMDGFLAGFAEAEGISIVKNSYETQLVIR